MSDKSFKTMQKMKPIVTDTYDFPTLVGEGYFYVDTLNKELL